MSEIFYNIGLALMLSFPVFGSSYTMSNYKLFGWIATFVLYLICVIEIIIIITQMKIESKEKKDKEEAEKKNKKEAE